MGVYALTMDRPEEQTGGVIQWDAMIYRRVSGTYAGGDETWKMVGHRSMQIDGDAILAVTNDEALTNFQKEQALGALGAADPWCADTMESDDAMEALIALLGTPPDYVGVEHPEWARDDEATGKYPIVVRIKE